MAVSIMQALHEAQKKDISVRLFTQGGHRVTGHVESVSAGFVTLGTPATHTIVEMRAIIGVETHREDEEE